MRGWTGKEEDQKEGQRRNEVQERRENEERQVRVWREAKGELTRIHLVR